MEQWQVHGWPRDNDEEEEKRGLTSVPIDVRTNSAGARCVRPRWRLFTAEHLLQWSHLHQNWTAGRWLKRRCGVMKDMCLTLLCHAAGRMMACRRGSVSFVQCLSKKPRALPFIWTFWLTPVHVPLFKRHLPVQRLTQQGNSLDKQQNWSGMVKCLRRWLSLWIWKILAGLNIYVFQFYLHVEVKKKKKPASECVIMCWHPRR